MTQVERLRGDLLARFPDVSATIRRPGGDATSCFMDVRRGEAYLMSVKWRPKVGFGLSTPGGDEDGYGSGADEVYADPAEAFARIAHLIETGDPTVPPESVRLAELRQARGLSQSEVARRVSMTQPSIAGMEDRDDIKVSTLAKVVGAMGARLRIFAEFDDGMKRELRF